MRKWRPPDVSAEDEWTVNHQIVIPRVYRPEILNLAHETPMSGHLGVNKTYHKIPPDVSAEDEWTVNHQIVIPRVYRPEILNLAHETPMSGHLGVIRPITRS